ncbi:MAG TPA: TolC family protein [Polyangia bacterium]|nr:TolC family protein [Polyangia bacterium]
MLRRRRWPRATLSLAASLLAAPAGAAAPAPAAPERPSVTPSEGATIEPPPAVPKITFAEAIQRALARNPTVGVALADIERADALVKEARAGWLPTLVGNGQYTHLDHERPRGAANPVFKQDEVYGSLTLTVPLVAAQGWTAEHQAKDSRHIAEASAADVRRLVAQATGNAFIAVIAQRLQLRSNETAIVNARAHADYAHTRLLGGIGRSIDDVRAQQDLATVLATRQSVLTGLARAREALGVLVGSSEPLDAVEAIDFGPLPTLQAALDESGRRSDIVAQQARIGAAETLRKDVWAYYAPYLAAVAQPYGQYGQQVGILDHWGWQVGLVLSLPLYDGGQRSGVARQRDAELAETRLELDGALRQARSDVRVAFEAMLRADSALASEREAAALAKRAYELAVTAYKAGATTNIEVLDAARQARDADSAAAAASDVARRARLDLLVASGRFP